MAADNKIENTRANGKLYGLVMCGGNSHRMGTDKSMLVYHEKPQCYHLYDMLQATCEKVFISCNGKQATAIEAGYEILIDDPLYNNIGPMAGLLTAFTVYPGNNFLITGCDYPFLDAGELANFSLSCKKENASAFYNAKDNLYEPLLAYYPSNAFMMLKEMHASEQYSLQYFLKMNNATKFYPADERSITSIDTYEEYMKAASVINKSTIEI